MTDVGDQPKVQRLRGAFGHEHDPLGAHQRLPQQRPVGVSRDDEHRRTVVGTPGQLGARHLDHVPAPGASGVVTLDAQVVRERLDPGPVAAVVEVEPGVGLSGRPAADEHQRQGDPRHASHATSPEHTLSAITSAAIAASTASTAASTLRQLMGALPISRPDCPLTSTRYTPSP